MRIRKATIQDIESILAIFENARRFMCESGNPNQWTNGYPSRDVALSDMSNGNLYVIEENAGDDTAVAVGVGDEATEATLPDTATSSSIVGVFTFIIGEEPTYKVIENGSWNYNLPYGTIHRIASSGTARNITKVCFEYCLSQIDYLRIDTHKDNLPMQNAIKRFGFKECGIIYVRNGERIAFDYKA